MSANEFCPEMEALNRWGSCGKQFLMREKKMPLDGREWERAVGEIELEKSMSPCPFCGQASGTGGHLYAEEVWRGNGWRVKCYQCQSSGPIDFTHAEAIAAWNKPARRRQKTKGASK